MAVAALAVLTIVPLLPGHSLLQERVGMVWSNFAPHVLGASLLLLLSVLVARQRQPGLAWNLAIAAATAIVLACATQIFLFVSAVRAAGGSVNLVAALTPRPFESEAPDAHEIYSMVDGKELRILIWKPKSAATPAPIVFEIHGGGWFSGAAAATGTSMRWFADQGWLAVSVDYRLSTPQEATWNKAPRDVACGLAWTIANAAHLGGDPNRIVVSGRSAGGNLAINLAYGVAAPGSPKSECGGKISPPRAVIAVVPVVDPFDAYKNGVAVPGAEPGWFVPQYIGGDPRTLAERVRAISSISYVSPRGPPTLIIEPISDGLIPAEGVFRFAERARAAGIDVTTAPLPLVNHHIGNANSIGDQAILTIAKAYLVERGLGPADKGRTDSRP